jgi:hypothetical protein
MQDAATGHGPSHVVAIGVETLELVFLGLESLSLFGRTVHAGNPLWATEEWAPTVPTRFASLKLLVRQAVRIGPCALSRLRAVLCRHDVLGAQPRLRALGRVIGFCTELGGGWDIKIQLSLAFGIDAVCVPQSQLARRMMPSR